MQSQCLYAGCELVAVSLLSLPWLLLLLRLVEHLQNLFRSCGSSYEEHVFGAKWAIFWTFLVQRRTIGLLCHIVSAVCRGTLSTISPLPRKLFCHFIVENLFLQLTATKKQRNWSLINLQHCII